MFNIHVLIRIKSKFLLDANMKWNPCTSVHFKIFISLLTISFITITVLSLNPQINDSKAENTIKDINFDFPLNNTFYLGAPFLVDYSTTTGLNPIGFRTTDIATEDFEVTFSGFGTINYGNNTIKHTSNSSGIYITNRDGTVYQKGVMELKAERGNDTAKAEYESIGYQVDEETVLDSGVIFFNSSTSEGELSFLNNTMAIYKDKIEKGQNITTIAWDWK
jgi:hypothetical protein